LASGHTSSTTALTAWSDVCRFNRARVASIASVIVGQVHRAMQSMRHYNQMIRPNTEAIGAFMVYNMALWDITIGHFIRKTMRESWLR
jgi:hypothetical protein